MPSPCSFCHEPVHWATRLADKRLLCEACRVVLFFESKLTLTGDWSGKPFILAPAFKQIVRDVFGTLDAEGNRVYREVYLEMGNSNGKTAVGAGLALFTLCGATTSGTEIYSAATARSQAGITFDLARQMVRQNADLSRRLSVVPSTRSIVRRDDPTCFYRALSADGDVNDGMAPSFVLRDEIHRWRTRKHEELNDVLERKMGKRTNPLIWDITTAGSQDDSPLGWRRHELALRHLQGDKIPRFYARIFAADAKRIEAKDEPDYWKSREAAVAGNPAHEDNGGHIPHSVFQGYIAKAEKDSLAKRNYLRFNLGYWGQDDLAAIDYPTWMANGGPSDLRDWPEYDFELLMRQWGLVDRTCYAGVDASWTTDLTSVVFVFPPEGEDLSAQAQSDPSRDPARTWKLLPFFWMPKDKIAKLEASDKQPYSDWCDRKFIEAIPGGYIDLAHIKDRLRWGSRVFDLREICYDPFNFRHAAQDLWREGHLVTEVKQVFTHLSAPTKHLLEIYPEGQLWHGNHPVLNFNARCLALQGDRKDNIQPSKPQRSKSSKRIDGLAATITAMHRALLAEPVQGNLVEVW